MVPNNGRAICLSMVRYFAIGENAPNWLIQGQRAEIWAGRESGLTRPSHAR